MIMGNAKDRKSVKEIVKVHPKRRRIILGQQTNKVNFNISSTSGGAPSGKGYLTHLTLQGARRLAHSTYNSCLLNE